MPTPRQYRPPVFRPSFTLSLFYLAGFFVFFALLLILPEMLDALSELPPDANAELEGASIARRIAGPRLLAAFALTLIAFGIGAYYQLLPGMRRP